MPKKPPAPRLVVHWWEDSGGRRTCHENRPAATAADSFLGEVKGNLHDGFYYRLSGSVDWVGPYNNGDAVGRALEEAAGGAPINIWD